VDDAVLFLARLSGGAIASFEATRLATGYNNGNRFEIHGERGALRFDFQRMNELEYFSLDSEAAVQGWTTIDVTSAASGHPYVQAWWPDGHGLGTSTPSSTRPATSSPCSAGAKPEFPLPDFADALKTQRVLHAAIASARNRTPVDVADV
jgi:predicted dehydrogenase